MEESKLTTADDDVLGRARLLEKKVGKCQQQGWKVLYVVPQRVQLRKGGSNMGATMLQVLTSRMYALFHC